MFVFSHHTDGSGLPPSSQILPLHKWPVKPGVHVHMNNGTHTLAVHPVGGSSETLNNNNTVHEGPEHNPGLASSEQPQSTELANPEKKKPSKKLWSLKRSDESIPSGGEIFQYGLDFQA